MIFLYLCDSLQRDVGGKNILSKNWASFLKARLNCSIPGEFPFYFNEIQHVFKHPDASKFYAVFSTSMNGLIGSAICSFSLDSISEVFNGKFKEQATSSSAWLPVLNSKVPEPRPGVCMNDTQSLPDSVLNFIRAHPLMDSAVPHENSKPVFFKRDVVFTKIVVDFKVIDDDHQDNNNNNDARVYTIYYAGTSTGLIYKIVEWSTSSGSHHNNNNPFRSQDDQSSSSIITSEGNMMTPENSDILSRSNSHLVDIFDGTSPEAIRGMEISSKFKSLYVASDSNIRQIDLYTCKTRYETCMRCTRDPYCGWDKNHGECKPYSKG